MCLRTPRTMKMEFFREVRVFRGPFQGGENMKRMIALWLLSLLSVSVVLASTTQIWRQDTADEFEQGTPTNITIRSDGYLQLAPQLDKLYETPEAFFWALAEDSRGRVFIGSGNEGKVYVYANGQGRVFFDAPEMEVHALAVDSQDNLYVGTSPNGKIYRVTSDGASQVLYEPGAKYIWALVPDGRGGLYVGTGEDGKIFRVDAQGRGQVFFDTEEKHIRTLAVDAQGNLIAGSANRARLFRFSPAGQPFLLYDAPVKEITSLVLAPDGTIYASGIGRSEEKPDSTVSPPSTPALTALDVITVTATAGVQEASRGSRAAAAPAETPGSTIYRIAPDGYPQEIWESDKVTIFSLAWYTDNSLLAGTGNKGYLYRIEPDGVHSAILQRVEPSQVTALLRSARAPVVYALTSNLTGLYVLKSDFVREGTFISQVEDSASFARWGRVSWRWQSSPGTAAKLFTRSGNTQDPDKTWSDWAEVLSQTGGQRVASPPARFIQWKLVLSSADGRHTPVVDSVELAYLPRNVAPKIESLVLQPPDVAFEPQPSYQTFSVSVTTSSSGGSASLQNQASRQRLQQQAATQAPPRQIIQEGYRTVTWQASDAHDDQLSYSVYIRGEGETTWKLLEDKLEDTFYSWDTTQMPDGYYRLRLVVSDAQSNPPEAALTAERITEWFEIDNTPPRIEGLSAVVESKTRVRVRFTARDSTTPISEADYLVDNVDPKLVFSSDGLLDTEQEDFDFIIEGLQPGEHTITVRIRDGADNLSSAKVIITIG